MKTTAKNQVSVLVTADASRDRVSVEKDGTLHVSVRAKAKGGLANKSACELVAKYFGKDSSLVHIARGHQGARKLIIFQS